MSFYLNLQCFQYLQQVQRNICRFIYTYSSHQAMQVYLQIEWGEFLDLQYSRVICFLIEGEKQLPFFCCVTDKGFPESFPIYFCLRSRRITHQRNRADCI